MKIQVKNFQSIKDVSLEAEGFTVITGPSNIGKSALIRAIDGAIFGIPGDYYVNFDADSCTVTLSDDAGDIGWGKVKEDKVSSKRQTSLTINNNLFTKFSSLQGEITKSFGIVEIPVNDESFKPQIASQFDPMFLLFNSPFEVAGVLNKLGRADIVAKAQALASKDQRDAQSRLKIRIEDTEKTKALLEAVSWVIDAQERYRDVSEELKATSYKASLIRDIIRNIDELEDSNLTLITLPSVPDKITCNEKLMQVIACLEELQNIEIKELPNAPAVNPTFADKLLAVIAGVEEFQTLKSITVPKKILLDIPEEIMYTVSLFDDLIQVEKERRQLNVELEELSIKNKALIIQLEEAKAALQLCPTCGRKYDSSPV